MNPQAVINPVASKPANPVLDVRGLTKQFPVGGVFNRRHVHALNAATFTVDEGEVVALVGESGSGKSTAARLIARLMPPTAGEIRFDGRDVLKAEPRAASLSYRRQVQMIFQDPFGSLSPRLSVGEIVEEGLLVHGLAGDRAARRARVARALEEVGLDPATQDRYPHEFSGGQRQRIAIARALALQPRLLVLDEPTSALDVSVQDAVLDLFEELQTDWSFACLFISHDLAVVDRLADEVAVLRDGVLQEIGTRDAVLRNPQTEYTRRLVAAVPVPDPAEQRRRREAAAGLFE